MKFEEWFCHGCGVTVTKEPWPHLDRRLLPMALLQQEGVDDMKEFLASGEENHDQPDYARGMIQAIVEIYEENGVNMVPVLREALSELLQGNE